MSLINLLLPFLYTLTFGVYLFDFIKGEKKFANSKRIFLFITLIIHSLYLLLRTVELNHPPITSVFEILTVLAFSVSLAYFLLELLTDIRGTGPFIIVFSIIFQIISSVFIGDNLAVPAVLRNRMLGLHVLSGLIGYSAITISAVYGLLFYVMYKQIRLNKFGLLFDRLPNLELLENLSYYASVIGFIMLSAAIVIGLIWLPGAFPDFTYLDPKLIATFLIWIVYGCGIVSKLLAGWKGRRVVLFSIVGFLITLLSILAANFLPYSFHTFY